MTPASEPSTTIHACTVDVEDYYHVTAFEDAIPRSRWNAIPERIAAATERVLARLAQADVHATFFVLGCVAARTPAVVQAIQRAGHQIGCHSYEHRLVYRLTSEEFRADLRNAKRCIEDVVGAEVRHYRAPSFSITAKSLWALEVLAEEGFTHDSSIYPVVHDRYGMPSAPAAPYIVRTPAGPIVEFPPTTFRLFGRRWPCCGGGYFRLCPYRMTAWTIRQADAEGRPANLYVHPWEFDPDQPRIGGLSWRTRFRHYVGLRKTAERFGRLLKEFRFGTLTQALDGLPALADFRVRGETLHAASDPRLRVETPGRAVPAGAS
jgi:polysaccharide deacetylase family protein (PEP-CTERM system associated)